MMYMVSVAQNEDSGAFAVHNRWGEKVIMFFEKEDDAERYAMMLQDSEKYNLVKVTEVDEDLAKKTCHHQNLKYVITTPNDIVVPPEL
jgi:hypothetical protein